MSRYALLVGIDTYQSDNIPNLGGCKNDIANIEKYLGASFKVKKLEDDEATRKNIIHSFRNHLGSAKAGELVLFYFSGHGSMEHSPQEFIPYQQDDKHETIVCHDSDMVIDGQRIYDIADKEIKLLIHELADKGVEIVIIYDCCHSGSGTRDFDFNGIREAIRNSNNANTRTKKDFLTDTFQLLSAKPKHLFMAACGLREKAREDFFSNDTLEGVFTHSLLQALQQTGSAISYSNLAYFCRNYIKVLKPDITQTPKLEVTGNFDAEVSFLKLNQYPQQRMVKVIQADEHFKWKVSIGAVHGLLLDAAKQPQFNIFADEKLTNLVCTATTSTINLAESTLIENKETGQLDPTLSSLDIHKIYYLTPTYLPLNKLPIYFSGITDQTNLFDGLPKTIKEEIAYTLELLTNEAAPTLYEVVVEKDGYRILYKETQTPILSSLIKKEYLLENHEIENGSSTLFQILLRIAKWERLRNLDIVRSGIFKSNQDNMSLTFCTDKAEWKPVNNAVTIDFNPQLKPIAITDEDITSQLQKIPFQVKVRNNMTSKFYCYPYYLSRKFQGFISLNVDAIPPNNSPKVIDETTIYIPVHKPEEKYINQVTDAHNVLFSKTSLPFLNLDMTKTLEEFYDALIVRYRDSERDRGIIMRFYNEWFTKKLTIKTLKELGTINKQPLTIADEQISFQSDSNFSAKVGIASSAKHMRGPMTDQIIKLKMEALGFDLVDFSSFKLAGFGDTLFKNKEMVLELHHIQNRESLKASPLSITLNLKDLGEDVSLLALTLPPSMDGIERQQSVGTFPILALLRPQSKGKYHLLLNNIPKNPNDGRAIPDASLKISFIKIPKNKKDSILTKIKKDKQGNNWLDLDTENYT